MYLALFIFSIIEFILTKNITEDYAKTAVIPNISGVNKINLYFITHDIFINKFKVYIRIVFGMNAFVEMHSMLLISF